VRAECHRYWIVAVIIAAGDSSCMATSNSGQAADAAASDVAFDGTQSDSSSRADAQAVQDATSEAAMSADAETFADATASEGGDATIADATASEGGDATIADAGAEAAVEAGAEGGSALTAIASEPGLYYGGCVPVVAAGKVFFCSATKPLDGTQGPLPDPSLTLKSVPVTGGAPTTIGIVVTPMCDPLCNFGQGSGGLYTDATHVYWIDDGAGAANTTITLNGAPLSGGSASPIATYTNGVQYANDLWTFDGTTIFGVYDDTSCTGSCTEDLGLFRLPLDGGAPSYVLQVDAPYDGGLPFGFFNFPSADPGSGGNVYITDGTFGTSILTKIPKSGGVFNVDGGFTGGLPLLAPNAPDGGSQVGLASDGTNVYALEWRSPSSSAVLLVPPNGSPSSVLANIPSSTLNTLYVDSGNVYWITVHRTAIDGGVQLTGTAVMRVDTTGTGVPSSIYDASASTFGAPTMVAFDATYAYVTTSLGNLVRVAK
jgi:hypothetical protein